HAVRRPGMDAHAPRSRAGHPRSSRHPKGAGPMKFRSLAFKSFGTFADRTLAFPDNGRDLHIIYGPNEAGKSTALAGLSYFLFGFSHLVTHAFRYVHGDQRIAATIEDR